MTSTLATYLQISNNMAKWQNLTAAEPLVKAQTEYYQKNIGSIKTPSDLVNNYRLFSYVMTAYGMGDQVYAKALVQKVLEQGTDDPKALAYKLNNPNMLALAKAFDFADYGDVATGAKAVQTEVVDNYIERTMEDEQGQSEPGVQLALYFQQHAPDIKNAYSILADAKLLKVVQTALGISEYASYQNIDTQAKLISNSIDIADFKDPKKLQAFIQKFSVLYDVTNPSATTAQNVPNALMTGASSTTNFSVDLLASMQAIKPRSF
jgi:hypothetical protein